MSRIRRVSHIGVCVSDMERSERFYCDVLGFVRTSELRVAGEPSDTLLQLRGVELHAVYIERDGFRLELLRYGAPRSPETAPKRSMNDLGFTHLSLQVDGIDAEVERLEKLGIAIERATLVGVGGQNVAVFVRDPDGLLIELVRAS